MYNETMNVTYETTQKLLHGMKHKNAICAKYLIFSSRGEFPLWLFIIRDST